MRAECIGDDTCCHDAEDCGGKLLLLTLADAVSHAEQPRDLEYLKMDLELLILLSQAIRKQFSTKQNITTLSFIVLLRIDHLPIYMYYSQTHLTCRNKLWKIYKNKITLIKYII